MAINLDQRKMFTKTTAPLAQAKKKLTRTLTRDVFAVANLLVNLSQFQCFPLWWCAPAVTGHNTKLGTTLKKICAPNVRVVPMLQGGERRQLMKLCIGLIDNWQSTCVMAYLPHKSFGAYALNCQTCIFLLASLASSYLWFWRRLCQSCRCRFTSACGGSEMSFICCDVRRCHISCAFPVTNCILVGVSCEE